MKGEVDWDGELGWDEIAPFVSNYTVEAGNPREMIWFRHAWGCLERRGLTYAGLPLDRCRSVVRFFALGQTYRDFAAELVQVPVDPGPEWSDICECLEVPAFHLAAILDPKDAENFFDETIDCEEMFIDNAISWLIGDRTQEIGTALQRAFGSKTAVCNSMYHAITGRKPTDPLSEDVARAYDSILSASWLFES